MTLQYDGVRPVVEGTLAGDTWSTTARNVWEGDTYYSPLVLRLLPSGGYNYLADGLGSTRQLMSNATHAITDTYMYHAFGNTLAATGTTDNPYRYVGALGYRAGGGEIMQLGFRYYAPLYGRFMTPDPLALNILTRATRRVPNAPYSYADGNPTAHADPSGLFSDTACFFICMIFASEYGTCLEACSAAATIDEIRKLMKDILRRRKICEHPNDWNDCADYCPGTGKDFRMHCNTCCSTFGEPEASACAHRCDNQCHASR